MPTLAAAGRSTERESARAARAAVGEAVSTLGSVPDLLLLFSTAGHDQATLVEAAHQAAGRARLAGCSGEGVIAGDLCDESDHAVGVLALRSDRIGFDTLLVGGYSADPGGAGAELARRVRALDRRDPFGLIVFPDGMRGDCGRLLASLDAELDRRIRVIGGAAGDAMTLERTYQYVDGEVTSDAVAAVLLHGRGRLEYAVSHGCSAIGLERRVTDAEGPWLRAIDGRPAWDVYREYLGPDAHDLSAENLAHLCVGTPLPADAGGDYEPYIIRTPLGLDQRSGAMFFPGGSVANGAPIHFTRRDPDKVRASAVACGDRIAARVAGRAPACVLQFDCAGRGRMLFGRHAAAQALWPIQARLGAGIPWAGFHTYGEIAPIGARTFYHNYTVVLAAICDEP